MKRNRIAYYVTAHGYGHGVRSCDIIRAVNSRYPELHVTIVSDLPPPFFTNRLGRGSYEVRSGSFDVGMFQLDSIRLNVAESLKRALNLHSRRRELIEAERHFLESEEVRLVAVDIPGIPLEAAALAGIPRIAVGNFGWDWIYSAYIELDCRWEVLVKAYKEAYSKADLLLQLPFSPEMESFPRSEKIPLVSSQGRDRREEIVQLTGADPAKKWVLISFTSLAWDESALDNVAKVAGYDFFTVLPLEWNRGSIHALDREKISFVDIVASMDAVITKPGYGILSDCVVNRKPVIYADRSDFLEYAVLEEEIKKYLKHLHIPADKLYRGEIGEAVESIWSRPDPGMTLPRGGEATASRRIHEFLAT